VLKLKSESFSKTERYIMVTQDIGKAFNTARWERSLETFGFGVPAYIVRIVRRIFTEPVLLCESSEGVFRHQVTGGDPQGSVLVPLLWNAMYEKPTASCEERGRLR